MLSGWTVWHSDDVEKMPVSSVVKTIRILFVILGTIFNFPSVFYYSTRTIKIPVPDYYLERCREKQTDTD